MFSGSPCQILHGLDRICSKGGWSWHVTIAAAKRKRERRERRRAICRALTDRGFQEAGEEFYVIAQGRGAMLNIRSDITRYRAYILRDWALP